MFRQILIDWVRNAKGWRYYLASHILAFSINKRGIWFFYKGDEVMYIYPWKRGVDKEWKFISLQFSGNGDFGDVKFKSLKDMDKAWDDYSKVSGPMESDQDIF
jgi:hypothetical protein